MRPWLAAAALDLLLGEPPAAMHPVVWMGRTLRSLERLAPRDETFQLVYGAAMVAIASALAAALGVAVRLLPRGPVRALAAAWLLKTTFSLRALLEAGRRVEEALERGDSARARAALSDLVSRPRGDLDDAHTASAAIESVAENLTDSYVAPLLCYAAGGLPAALAYRAVNTADAMVGYRGRYELLGKASARVDDALGWIPARAAAAALVAATPLVGLDLRRALETSVRDHRRTESPNAGWTMAAVAGALGVWLEKLGHYRLGDGRAPVATDVARARRLVLAAAVLSTVAVAAVVRR